MVSMDMGKAVAPDRAEAAAEAVTMMVTQSGWSKPPEDAAGWQKRVAEMLADYPPLVSRGIAKQVMRQYAGWPSVGWWPVWPGR